jgi:hypothetical protein
MDLFRHLLRRHGEREGEELVPITARYDFWRGDLDLTNVKETDCDRELRSFFQRFAARPEKTRIRIREKMYPEHATELKWHPLRSAVLALRSGDADWIESGLTAIAATDSRAVGSASSSDAVAFLFRIGSRLSANDVYGLFRRAAGLADSPRASLILEFLPLPETKKAHFAAFETEVQTADGPGFILTGNAKRDTAYNLAQIIARMRAVVAADQYEPQVVSRGESVPDFWFRRYSTGTQPVPLIERGQICLTRSAMFGGTASIVARLRPENDINYQAHSLLVELIECSEIRTREFLCDRLNGNPTLSRFVHLAAGPLICAVAAISGPPASAYENQEKLARFALPLSEILNSARTVHVTGSANRTLPNPQPL